jgi:hypothetical protein
MGARLPLRQIIRWRQPAPRPPSRRQLAGGGGAAAGTLRMHVPPRRQGRRLDLLPRLEMKLAQQPLPQQDLPLGGDAGKAQRWDRLRGNDRRLRLADGAVCSGSAGRLRAPFAADQEGEQLSQAGERMGPSHSPAVLPALAGEQSQKKLPERTQTARGS